MRCPRCWRRVAASLGCEDHGAIELPGGEPLPTAPPATLPDVAPGPALAVGGSAQVFAVSDARVIKWGRWRDVDLRHRFAHEAAVLDELAGDVAPRLLGRGAVDGWPYLDLERLRGPTLAALMTAPLPDPLAILAQLAEAVARLHARGVVHGDLKPENVIVTDAGVRILDFGLATLHGQRPPGAAGGGTLHYLAPEQLGGDALTPATDAYALGVIGFELVTRRPPFVGDRPTVEYGHQLCRPPRAGELAAVAPELDELIAACLAKAPARRPDVATIRATMARLSTSVAATPAAVPAPRRDRGPAALVWIASRDRLATARIVGAHRGRLVRERPAGTLAAFTWLDHEAPLAAALAVARELGREQVPIAIHTGTVDARQRGAGVRLFGDAVDRADGWIPRAPWTGLVLTADVNAPGLACEDCATHPGFRRVIERGAQAGSAAQTVPDLLARDGLIADVVAAIDAGQTDARPRLITIVGDPGLGKTRLLDELATIARARRWRTVRVGGAPTLAARGHVGAQLARALDADAVLPGLRAAGDEGIVALVDDGHWIEDEVLDALLTAAAWPRGRVAIVVATDPGLTRARPGWGDGVEGLTYQLPPLPRELAHRLVRRLLLPAVRVPAPLIERLAARAHGNPGALVAIARELHHGGLVRPHPDSDEWYVAADEIDLVALEPDQAWRAARALATLPAGLAELYCLAALLGPRFDAAEVEAIAARLPRGAIAIDPGSGLSWLERHGWLQRRGPTLAAASPGLAEAACAQLVDDDRRQIHRAAFDHWHAADDAEPGAAIERLERLAHHGPGCAEPAIAGRAFLTLARHAAARVAYVEAERLATHAIALLDPVAPLAAAEARLERARVRGPLSRFEGARADLAEVRAAARGAGARVLEIEALVADAAVCDFADWMAESAAAVEAAAALAEAGVPDATAARLASWLGVVRMRQERPELAEPLLVRALALADQVDDYPVAVGARFMLGATRRRRGDAAGGLALVDEALAMTRARGDVFHETVGLFNRINYGIALGAPAQAAADCAAAIELAECHGYGDAEFRGWCNLANVRVQLGDADGARDAARRAYAVARRRFGKHPPVVASLILAALEVGLGDRATAADLIAAIDRAEAAANGWTRTLLTAIELATAGAPDPAWAPVEIAIAAAEPEDRALLAWLRARAA
ncbi:MAG: protein kinase [Myxococcales bacterium]|nr:protein kinase [Myxococcales bacterium]